MDGAAQGRGGVERRRIGGVGKLGGRTGLGLVGGRDQRQVVGGGDGHRQGRGAGAEMVVGNLHRGDERHLLARRREVERAVGDLVGPVDRAVVGVAGLGGNLERRLDGGDLPRRQRQRGGAV